MLNTRASENGVVLSFKSRLLVSAGGIASASAIWHLLCIIGGPGWFIFARAPQQIIESAQQGTMLAPIGTIIIATLMFACTMFAFSGAGLIRKVPLLKPALITIALLCILRALLGITSLVVSIGFDIWQFVASSVWLYVGICFAIGSLAQFWPSKSSTQQTLYYNKK